MNKFTELPLAQPIQKALEKVGYTTPTPIQKETIPLVLAGHDVLGIAQTGTGKTAAFCLPILHLLHEKKAMGMARSPRVLILTPTRELAIQIHQSLIDYGHGLNQRYTVIFGGVKQGKQVTELQKGPHVLVATPGRLLDLIEQGFLSLNKVEVFVLDEADRMLDMGFLRDIKRILPMLPPRRHSLFFSATMPPEIQSLANNILSKPKKVEVTPQSTTVKKIIQSAMYVDKADKIDLLVHLLKDESLQKVLVFVQMKHIANRITEKLIKAGVNAAAIHGNKSQPARQRAIKDFTDNRVRVLVATDIASRGIDIDGITHVINFELSNIMESYVHRIGRTARAGTDGFAISLVTGEEKSFLVGIEKSTNQKVFIDTDHPYHSEEAANAAVMSVGKAKAQLESQRKSNRPSQPRRSPGRNSGQRKSQHTERRY